MTIRAVIMTLVTLSTPSCRPRERIRKPAMTETAIKPHCLAGEAIMFSNSAATPSVSRPSKVPAAVVQKYWSIQPQTVV